MGFNPGGSSSSIAASTDVVLSNPANLQVLTYDSSLGKWKNAANVSSDATTSSKGVVQLTGDLAGTAASPSVAKINGVAVSGTPSSGQVLSASSATAASWAAPATGFADPTTTKGDLIVHASTTTRLAVGSDGQVLTADSTQTAGVKWASLAAANPTGMTIVATATGTAATDTTNIGTAITAAGQNGVVWFPPGTYVADSLVPLNGQTWTGNATIKRPNGSTNMIVATSNLSAFRVSGLTFDGNKANSTATYQSMLQFTTISDSHFDSCRFQNGPTNNPGLELRGAQNCTVENCSFITLGYGVIIGNLYGVTTPVYNNSIVGCVMDGIDLNGIFLTENIASVTGSGQTVSGLVQGTVVSGCTIRNFGDVGIESGSGCVNTQISGCVFYGTASGNNGLLFRDNSNSSAADCQIFGLSKSGSRGVYLLNLNGTNNGILLDNIVSQGGTEALCLAGATNVTVSGGCYCLAAADGIYIDGSDRWSINGVEVRGNANQGISVGTYNASSGTNGLITNCQIFDNSAGTANSFSGICLFMSSTATITNNRIGDSRSGGAKTQRFGVNIFDATVVARVIDNDLTGNATTAFNNQSNNVLSSLVRNAGLNPAGPAAVTVGSSPWIYTAGLTPEVLYISGGTISGVIKAAGALPVTTTYALDPGEQIQLTYSAAPTATTDRR